MISVIRLRNELRTDPTKDDENILDLNAVVAQWERLTAKLWKIRSGVTKTFRPTNTDIFLWIPLLPVTSLSIKEWDDDVKFASATTTDPAEYELNAKTGSIRLIKAERDLSRWSHNVEATFSGGYADDAWPEDVVQVCLRQLRYGRVRSNAQRLGIESTAVSTGTTSYMKDTYLPEFLETARAYRRNIIQ